MQKDYGPFCDMLSEGKTNNINSENNKIYNEVYRNAHPIVAQQLSRLNFADSGKNYAEETDVPTFGEYYHHKEPKLTRKFDGII